MHDGRLRRYSNNYAPTRDEFDMIQDICNRVNAFSKREYNKDVVVKAPLLFCNNAFRIIEFLSTFYGKMGGVEKPVIFEIGPGNGMLGAMLHNAGYSYFATDITQAFYIEQNHLWNGLFPKHVNELCVSGNKPEAGDRICHIPYWKLWELRKEDLGVDIMICNAALAEMSDRSLRFYLQFGKAVMRSSKLKLFAAQSTGSLFNKSWESVLKNFYDCGYKLIYSSNNFYIFHITSDEDENKLSNVIEKNSEREAVIERAKRILPQGLRTAAYNTVRTIKRKKFDIQLNADINNVLADYLKKCEEYRNRQEKVKYEEMMEFFNFVSKSYDTPDEEFIHYVGYEYL